MKILDEIQDEIARLTVSAASRVSGRARKIYGGPIQDCGEALHEHLTATATECKESFYAPCGEKLGKAVEVCPAFGPATEYNHWKEGDTLDRIKKLEAKITKLEGK